MTVIRSVTINEHTHIQLTEGQSQTVTVIQRVPYASRQQVSELTKNDLHRILSVLKTQQTHIPPASEKYELMGHEQLLDDLLFYKTACAVDYSGSVDELELIKKHVLARMGGTAV